MNDRYRDDHAPFPPNFAPHSKSELHRLAAQGIEAGNILLDETHKLKAEITSLRYALEQIKAKADLIAGITTGGPATHHFVRSVHEIASDALEGKP